MWVNGLPAVTANLTSRALIFGLVLAGSCSGSGSSGMVATVAGVSVAGIVADVGGVVVSSCRTVVGMVVVCSVVGDTAIVGFWMREIVFYCCRQSSD